MNIQTEQTTTQDRNKAEASKPAVIMDLRTRERVNVEVRERLHKLINNQVRASEGLYATLFRLARECGDGSTFHGTLAAAEYDVCQENKVRNMNQLNKSRDQALASYLTCKSNIERGINNAADWSAALQELWTWEAEHEGTERKYLPVGFLDAFHNRYEENGATLFRKDCNTASQAAITLQTKKAAWDKAQAKARQEVANNGSHTEQTPAQVRSGGGITEKKLPESWTEALNNLKSTLGKLAENVEFAKSDLGENVPKCLERAEQAIAQCYKDYFDRLAKASSEHSARPSAAAAGRYPEQTADETGNAPEMPEVSTEGDTPLSAEEEQYIKDHAPDSEAPAPSTKAG